MRVLALDTATEACSAALLIGTEVRARYELAPRQHANLILMMIDQLLAEAGIALGDLDGLAFGRGPGGFTGVRIATGVVQGLAFGASLPVAPVSTLQALAQGAWRELGHERVLAAIDARMDEVYWGAYELEDGQGERTMVLRGEERVVSPDAVSVPSAGASWFGAGSGWYAHGAALVQAVGERLAGREDTRYPQAHDIAVLGAAALRRGEGVAAEQALPVYLRDEVAWKRSRPVGAPDAT
ncbi:MAG TPA: tRNA (adenosine(37)-N6)-threonylcarbamoyltransferase complex dimerization subunit type 1 TsaB [Gammaproteobacteria bacterium]|nr:tRNA (adenosine(37)-N6)-threonylcarbamoyltransferase complex dimerization subunit type 1 TsaB [Gammaproteobacteria bacterium]